MLKRRFSSGQLYLVLYFDSLVGNGDQPLHIHADIHTLNFHIHTHIQPVVNCSLPSYPEQGQ